MTKTIRSERKINTPRSTDFIVFFYMKNFGQLIELNVKCYFLAFLLTHSFSVFLNFYPVPSSLWSEICFYFSVLTRIKQLDSSSSNESLEQKTGTRWKSFRKMLFLVKRVTRPDSVLDRRRALIDRRSGRTIFSGRFSANRLDVPSPCLRVRSFALSPLLLIHTSSFVGFVSHDNAGRVSLLFLSFSRA